MSECREIVVSVVSAVGVVSFRSVVSIHRNAAKLAFLLFLSLCSYKKLFLKCQEHKSTGARDLSPYNAVERKK